MFRDDMIDMLDSLGEIDISSTANYVFIKQFAESLHTQNGGISIKFAEEVAAGIDIQLQSNLHEEDPELFNLMVEAYAEFVSRLIRQVRQDFKHPTTVLKQMTGTFTISYK